MNWDWQRRELMNGEGNREWKHWTWRSRAQARIFETVTAKRGRNASISKVGVWRVATSERNYEVRRERRNSTSELNQPSVLNRHVFYSKKLCPKYRGCFFQCPISVGIPTPEKKSFLLIKSSIRTLLNLVLTGLSWFTRRQNYLDEEILKQPVNPSHIKLLEYLTTQTRNWKRLPTMLFKLIVRKNSIWIFQSKTLAKCANLAHLTINFWG